jgi:hypothetical protein
MNPSTIVEFSGVSGQPKAKLDLPCPLRIGDRIAFRFRLARENGGRSEQLDVVGDFRVKAVSFDASTGVGLQKLVVEAEDKAPVWRAVKKPAKPSARKLSPACWPTTAIE